MTAPVRPPHGPGGRTRESGRRGRCRERGGAERGCAGAGVVRPAACSGSGALAGAVPELGWQNTKPPQDGCRSARDGNTS
ncbi:hypothetical protein AV530_014335 [Patagioenas fasciata monilis]|uniref:Uncharacterized protein n=1 Tax=Patagioenas fasciata monilis TaxID=372326 RepID=A0A1V4KBP1_PATFA|nr:hypothetical protein AV530_014335 [Patagioenas fasciata monilis]